MERNLLRPDRHQGKISKHPAPALSAGRRCSTVAGTSSSIERWRAARVFNTHWKRSRKRIELWFKAMRILKSITSKDPMGDCSDLSISSSEHPIQQERKKGLGISYYNSTG